mmetsp:Transcript_129282/g.360050  ORF Transcript_129282/g.360050 Transcript_129282/m.360050 type:complete len:200 (+) Transcript_129282:1404-2003(+)
MRTSLSCPADATSLLSGETAMSFTSFECATTVTIAFSTVSSSPPPATRSSSFAALGSSQTFMILSWLPLTSHNGWPARLVRLLGRFFGKDKAETGPEWPARRHTHMASVALQTITDWSLPPVAIQRPSGETSQAITMSLCPRSNCAPKPRQFTRRGCSSFVTHTNRLTATWGGPPSGPSGQLSSGMSWTCTMSSLWPMM